MSKQSVEKLASVLSSSTRLNIVELLSDRPYTVSELRDTYESHHEDMRRESIYRQLEILNETEIVSKKYDEENKQFLYHLNVNSVEVDLSTIEMELRS